MKCNVLSSDFFQINFLFFRNKILLSSFFLSGIKLKFIGRRLFLIISIWSANRRFLILFPFIATRMSPRKIMQICVIIRTNIGLRVSQTIHTNVCKFYIYIIYTSLTSNTVTHTHIHTYIHTHTHTNTNTTINKIK